MSAKGSLFADKNHTTLQLDEIFWRDIQPWLETKGYELRSRYKPGWTASWGEDDDPYTHEDGAPILVPHILDATRTSDGQMVVLKRISRLTHPHEMEITAYFSSPDLKQNPLNHCIPLFDTLKVPSDNDHFIFVFPMLRRYNDPRFKTVGEAVEFFRQLFEGLQFMHHNHVAHRDCMNMNIMMDPTPLFPDMYHPRFVALSRDFKGFARHYTRTSHPTKYYFIDFGLSQKFNPADGPPRAVPIHGGDKSVPEFKDSVDPMDPFPTDIYYIGNLIREDFLQRTRGVEFMLPLVVDMIHPDPSKRPTVDEVVRRFEEIRGDLSIRTLRSRLVEKSERRHKMRAVVRDIQHFFMTVSYILHRRNPLPTPRH